MKTRKMRGGEIKRKQLSDRWTITHLGEGRVKEYREAEEYVFNLLALKSAYLDSNDCLQFEVPLLIEAYRQLCEEFKQDMKNKALYDTLSKIKESLVVIEDRRTREDIAQNSSSRTQHERRTLYWLPIQKSVDKEFANVEKAIRKKAAREEREKLIETNTSEIERINLELKKHLTLGELTQMMESDKFLKSSTDSLIGALNSQIPLIQATMEKDIERHPTSKEAIQEKASAAIRSIEERVGLISLPLEYHDKYSESLRAQYAEVSELTSKKERLDFEIKGYVTEVRVIEEERVEEEKEERKQYEATLQSARDKSARNKAARASEPRLTDDEVLEQEMAKVKAEREALERRGEPAEEPQKGEPAEEPERMRKEQRYKENQAEYERLTEAIQKGYLEQGALTKDTEDIEDLLSLREEILRVLEMTELTPREREEKEKELADNLSEILKVNPKYLELVKESDEKLKEIFKLGMILSKVEQYIEEHYDDIAPPESKEPTEEERLAQLEEDVRVLPQRERLTRLVDKEKLYRDVSERIEKLKEAQTEKRKRLDKTVLEFNELTATMPADTQRNIENWTEIFGLFSELPEEEKMGKISMDVISKLITAKDILLKEPHHLTPVVVNTIERYIIKIHSLRNETKETQIILDSLLPQQARLSRELEIFKKKRGGTRRKKRIGNVEMTRTRK